MDVAIFHRRFGTTTHLRQLAACVPGTSNQSTSGHPFRSSALIARQNLTPRVQLKRADLCCHTPSKLSFETGGQHSSCAAKTSLWGTALSTRTAACRDRSAGTATLRAALCIGKDALIADDLGVQLTAKEDAPPFVVPFKPVEGPSVWYGGELTKEDISYHFTRSDVAEIEAAVDRIQERGLEIKHVTKYDFPLPTLGPKLEAIHKDLVFGRGVRVLRGAPLGVHLSAEKAVIAMWGISSYFGKHQVSGETGELVTHVRHDKAKLQRAPIFFPDPMDYHADNSDVLLLGCRAQAERGGDNSCVSSHAIHNEVLRTRPDLHKVLTEPFYLDRGAWWPTGKKPYYMARCFNYHKNTLAVQEVSNIEEPDNELFGTPKPTELQLEAARYVQELAGSDKLRLDLKLQPGDIWLMHQLTTFHARSSWIDGETEETTRHLLGILVASPHGWPLDPMYEDAWSTTEIGNRGSLTCPGTETPHVTVDFDRYMQTRKAWVEKYGATADTASLRGEVTKQPEDIKTAI